MTDVLICDAARTPIGRYGGMLARMRTDDLAAFPIRALIARNPDLDPATIDEIIVGCANQAGEDNRNVARMALLLAGVPDSVPGVTINRLCASGLEALVAGARAIRSGEMDLVIAGGVESMSRAPLVMGKAEEPFSRKAEIYDTTIGWRFVNPAMQAKYGVDSMPETAENLAAEAQIGRDSQDAYALRSQGRAAAAIARGFYAEEIVALDVPAGRGTVRVTADEQPRPDTTAEALAKLRPIVKPGGTVTAGNASSVNDGAAALILASPQAAERHGLRPRARVLGAASAGVPPRIMGIGPVPATNRLCERIGLSLADFDAIEINEAFAAQVLACLKAFGFPEDVSHVNANGGAIALGHPLGMSGTRLAMTLVHRLETEGGKLGLATLCVGVGQGLAVAIERISAAN
jgi:3-oxoadipyl-CoA thiolase